MSKHTYIAVVLLSIAAWPALAQQAANQSGRALDANNQVGSGGVNQSAYQVDFRARNDVVTGNVAGGRGFQGNVGYVAPGSLQIGAPTDSLFNFRVNSLPSSPVRLNAARTNPAQPGSTVSVYRTFTEIPTYRTGGRVFNPSLYRPGSGYQTVASGAGTPGFITGTDDGLQSARPTVDVLGMVPQADGRMLEISASPLFGLKHQLRSPAMYGVRRQLITSGQNQANPNLVVPEDDASGDGANLNAASRVDGSASNTLSSGIGTMGLFANAPAKIAPGLIIGQQLETRVRVENANETFDQRVKRLEQSIFSPLGGTSAKPGEDVYVDLLSAVKQRDENQTLPTNTFGNREAQDADQSSSLSDALEIPSLIAIERAEEQSQAAAEKNAADGEPVDSKPLGDLLNQLDYNLPRLETLAGSSQDRFNGLMKKAEADLVAGKYFGAEAIYRQALIERPGSPVAQAGLVHAQLGAGMIRSAAFNLRRLFEQHPELIAARYSDNLLPSAARLKWVQSELQKMIDANNTGQDAGLMMGYLGYQVGSRQLVRYGLAIAQSQATNDALLPVLKRIWLDQKNEATK